MCGINGIFSYRKSAPPVNLEEIILTRDFMYKRGPNGYGDWISGDHRIGFGHRRLAIIELSELGAQPMILGDEDFVISYNGEIYNHDELRRELEIQGVTFRGQSDTEVILKLYRQYGLDVLKKLRGMFAFSLWDKRQKKLVLARDPFGIKPLYYHNDKGCLRFSSEVKALVSGNGFSKEVAPEGIVSFLLWGSVSEPLTLYKNVKMLPAGHVLEVSFDKTPKLSQFCNMSQIIERSFKDSENITADAAVKIAKTAIKDSVKAHMVSDVPVGVFLSAGLDSATISGLACQFSPYAVKAVTLGFDEFKGKALDETIHASLIARELGLDHTIITLSMNRVEDEFTSFFSAMDQPTIDGINTWMVSSAATSAGMKVALSGLGGDELLGGYSTFQRIPEIINKVNQLNNPILINKIYFNTHKYLANHFNKLDPNKSAFFEMGKTLTGAYQLERGLFMPWQLAHILDADFLKVGLDKCAEHMVAHDDEDNNLPLFSRLIKLESSRYMKNQLLRDSDWIGMAHSLEIRVPLVDRILFERIAGLSSRKLLGQGKQILPSTLKKKLPNQILERPKTGFTVPIWRWLNNSEMLSDWKKNKMLGMENINVNKRLAYCILSKEKLVCDYLT